VADQLLVTLEAGLAAIDQRDQPPALVDVVAVDARERADAAGRGPGTAAQTIGDGDPLTALDQRPDLPAGENQWFERDHQSSPDACPQPTAAATSTCSDTGSTRRRLGRPACTVLSNLLHVV